MEILLGVNNKLAPSCLGSLNSKTSTRLLEHLETNSVRHSWKGNHISDIGHPSDIDKDAIKT